MTPEEIEELERLVEDMHNYDHELSDGAREVLHKISDIVLKIDEE